MAKFPVTLVQEAPTDMVGATFTLSPGKTRTFKGGPLGRHRKQIIITNEDNSDKLYITFSNSGSSDTTQPKIMTIFPNSSITIFTSADITLYNPSASASVGEVQVIETFYR